MHPAKLAGQLAVRSTSQSVRVLGQSQGLAAKILSGRVPANTLMV